MRTVVHRFLFRLGLTGQLVLITAGLMALSLAVVGAIVHMGVRATIRKELRITETVRIDRWAGKHSSALQSDDHWKLAEAIEEVSRDPYVVFAGLYDRAGQPIAHSGSPEAYREAHTMDLLIPLRTASGAAAPEPAGGDEASPPLPGMVADPRKAAAAVPFRERFHAILEGPERPAGDLLGWVEVTLTTSPLDALLDRIMGRVVLACAVLLAVSVLVVWRYGKSVSEPLRALAVHAEKVGEGDLDEPFEVAERPADEVGTLVTQFSIMLQKLRRERGRT